MSSLLSAELAATCNALGYYDAKSNKYYADSNTLETVKDLIRYLRRDDERHDIRRQLGETKVLQADLLPLLKSYWEEADLFDVLLRLLVNLTTPALMLWNEEPPTDKESRNLYLQIEDHLKCYKQAFADETFWAVLSTRLSKILEIDYSERGDENSLIIERILILIRNIVYVPPDPTTEKRPDNDASIHDQVLWALHQSGMLDIILYISSSANEKAYYMHTLEILSFMLREQRASELAQAALQRSETEKIRDEAELLAIRHRETNRKQQKARIFTGARHSRFGGTYVLKSMKSISDNELIYHKPLNKLDALNFDIDKKKPKTPKNRLPVQSSTFERRSAFSIRLFLKEFCVEFINGAYNTLMYYVKDNLVRAKAQAHDESYYLWALRFFMEFNRCYKFEVKLVSETMSVQAFRYVQQLMENYFDMIQSDKKKLALWSRRLHLALLAYRELLLTICVMDKSPDGTVKDSARVIKNNIFYILEYRELIITLLLSFDELKMSNTYLKDLMETQHIFIKMLESFCKTHGAVVVQKKSVRRKKKKNAGQERAPIRLEINLESQWDEVAPQLSALLDGNLDSTSDVVPFDAASDVPIDEQKSEAMKNVQRKLRNGEFENAISLLRAAREVWPENDCFGSNNMAPEEEFLALRDIFFADLGENETSGVQEQPIYDAYDEVEQDDEEEEPNFAESDFQFADFSKRLANAKIVRSCGLALRDFETNSVNTNHCIVKLLHRVAFDCKMYVMVFQVSIFRTFQKIYSNKDFPQHRELVKFATYIIRQFLKLAETNKKVYMEALFWKNSTEAYEVEHGYGSFRQNKGSAQPWTEVEEDELRRLFMEHQQNQLEDDVVDWIVNNLIDNTRSRRGVLKKLKEMYLLTEYKGRRKSGAATKIPRLWGAEEEAQLRELFEQFRDASDPLGCIMARLNVSRSRSKIAQKLLELGLIQSKSEVRKKRNKKSHGSGGNWDQDAGSDLESSGSDSSADDDDDNRGPSTSHSSQTARPNIGKKKKSASRVVKRTAPPISYERVAKRLIGLVNSGMSEALEWLKECFSDAMEDFESDENSEGIPLVPIMDYAIDALENTDFLEALKALGICEPFDEQESYWRIPGSLSLQSLKNNMDILESAINCTLPNTEAEPIMETESSAVPSANDRMNDIYDGVRQTELEESSNDNFRQNQTENNRTKKRLRNIIDSDDDSDLEEGLSNHSSQPQVVIDSDLNDDVNNKKVNAKRSRIELDSSVPDDVEQVDLTSQKEVLVRNIIDNDSEDDNEELRNGNKLTSSRRKFVDSDSDVDKDNRTNDVKRSRIVSDSDSGSDTDKPVMKRTKYILSDNDDD